MALFGNKKSKKSNELPVKSNESKAVSKTQQSSLATHHSSVLVRPRITEKAAQATARDVYTFEVSKEATKESVTRAVKELYNVEPTAVRMVNTKGKRVSLRTRRGWGTKRASKKAYVSLKKGDRIEFAS